MTIPPTTTTHTSSARAAAVLLLLHPTAQPSQLSGSRHSLPLPPSMACLPAVSHPPVHVGTAADQRPWQHPAATAATPAAMLPPPHAAAQLQPSPAAPHSFMLSYSLSTSWYLAMASSARMRCAVAASCCERP
jgi:hypothetical protein